MMRRIATSACTAWALLAAGTPATAQDVQAFSNDIWFNACGMPPDYELSKRSICGERYTLLLDIADKGKDKGMRTVAAIENATGRCAGSLHLPALPEGWVYYSGIALGDRAYHIYTWEDKAHKEVVFSVQWFNLPELEAGPMTDFLRSHIGKDSMYSLYKSNSTVEASLASSQEPEVITLRPNYSDERLMKFSAHAETGVISALHGHGSASNGDRVIQAWTFDRDMGKLHHGKTTVPVFPMTYVLYTNIKTTPDGRAMIHFGHHRSEGMGAMMGSGIYDYVRYLLLLDDSGLSPVKVSIPDNLALQMVDLEQVDDDLVFCALAFEKPLKLKDWESNVLVSCRVDATGHAKLVVHKLNPSFPASRIALQGMPDGTCYLIAEGTTLSGKVVQYSSLLRILRIDRDGSIIEDTRMKNPANEKGTDRARFNPVAYPYALSDRLAVLLVGKASASPTGATAHGSDTKDGSDFGVCLSYYDDRELTPPVLLPGANDDALNSLLSTRVSDGATSSRSRRSPQGIRASSADSVGCTSSDHVRLVREQAEVVHAQGHPDSHFPITTRVVRTPSIRMQ